MRSLRYCSFFFGLLMLRVGPRSLSRFMAILMLFILAQVCLVGTSLWLRHWIKNSEETQDGGSGGSTPSLNLFLAIYALLTLLYVTIYVVVSWLTFAVARIRSSELLHRNLSTKVLHLSMSFFDITPLGRICKSATLSKALVEKS